MPTIHRLALSRSTQLQALTMRWRCYWRYGSLELQMVGLTPPAKRTLLFKIAPNSQGLC